MALAALVAGALFVFGAGREADIVVVRRAPIVQSVVATGRVATPARIEVSSQLAARIERISVREGDAVKAGAVLVQLRSDEAEAALVAARAALRRSLVGARARRRHRVVAFGEALGCALLTLVAFQAAAARSAPAALAVLPPLALLAVALGRMRWGHGGARA
ncbi:MAG: biotin/lipoyl-binding protein [Labilithrix sp.]|nr:biotin/lipoyl-binding protein [Labilithrix sp.]